MGQPGPTHEKHKSGGLGQKDRIVFKGFFAPDRAKMYGLWVGPIGHTHFDNSISHIDIFYPH